MRTHYYSTSRDFVQLSPHYGPGQNSPKELATLRVTRELHNLGRAAIFSSSPYVETAIESLIPRSPGAVLQVRMAVANIQHRFTDALIVMCTPQGTLPWDGSGRIPSPEGSKGSFAAAASRERPYTHGRLPGRGSKSAAMQRARRLVSANAPFLPEVPFADAVRVCNLAGDKTAMPALLQVCEGYGQPSSLSHG